MKIHFIYVYIIYHFSVISVFSIIPACFFPLEYLQTLNFKLGGWGGCSTVKSTGCSCREPDPVPSTHCVAHNCLQLQCQQISHSLLASIDTKHTHGVYAGRQNIHIHKKNNLLKAKKSASLIPFLFHLKCKGFKKNVSFKIQFWHQSKCHIVRKDYIPSFEILFYV